MTVPHGRPRAAQPAARTLAPAASPADTAESRSPLETTTDSIARVRSPASPGAVARASGEASGQDFGPGQAARLYNLQGWADGYFRVGPRGRLLACPRRRPESAIDLYELALRLGEMGHPPPILVRFPDILGDRLGRLRAVFTAARDRHDYRGGWRAVYPVKVNQQHSVVAAILRHGGQDTGLEAGSKPELMLALALAAPGRTVICNGYKDREYLHLACAGVHMGLAIHLVADKLSELRSTLDATREAGVRPALGLRVRLASIAGGNWQNTGGEKSKFGLAPGQVLAAIEQLRAAGRLEDLRLLHFHIGSQVTDVREFQRALHEGARYYAELRAAGAPIDTVDVGGGLGIDYEGTRSTAPCSMNYSMEEYAEVTVQALARTCREDGLPPPTLISECGRAMTAHHALLITDVIDTERAPEGTTAPAAPDLHLLRELQALRTGLEPGNAATACCEANHFRNEAREMFTHGLLGLAGLARAEELYFQLCRAALPLLQDTEEPEYGLRRRLADKYFCNFSVFRAIPDAWAIRQVFPVVPLHRLDRLPERQAVLHDLTCDSDGRLDRYVTRDGTTEHLPLHAPAGRPYLLGIFLVGAYQEILGDPHNLFGTTASADVELEQQGGYRVTELSAGEQTAELLRRVRLDPDRVLTNCERKLHASGAEQETRTYCLELLRRNLQQQTYLGPPKS